MSPSDRTRSSVPPDVWTDLRGSGQHARKDQCTAAQLIEDSGALIANLPYDSDEPPKTGPPGEELNIMILAH